MVLPVLADADGPVLGPGTAELLDELDVDLFTLLERARATGAVGDVVEHAVLDATGLRDTALTRVLLLGVGAGEPHDLRRAAALAARRVRGEDTVALGVAALADDSGLAAVVDGVVLGSYGFHRRSTSPSEVPAGTVVLAGLHDVEGRAPVVERALRVARASWTARTLALTPSNEKTPVWLAEQAEQAAAEHGLRVEVLDEHRLAEQGFGGLVGVGQGSVNPPRLVRLDYVPGDSGGTAAPLVVLAGKGITFDTGGLSIKPRESMETMKRDMTGAGVVLAVMTALAAVGCPVRVTGLLACAENSVGGGSLRPGDVIRHYGGRTSEVTNTDAEGRLVLADALAYAVGDLGADALVDVATLTGAIKLALGQRRGGLFSNRDRLAAALLASGAASGEPLWRMPLPADYEERLCSSVADADNAPGGPGAVTAALFLQHFVGDLPWAHLDIASVGDSPVDAYEYTQGATGFGARVLLHWLGSPTPLDGVLGAGRENR